MDENGDESSSSAAPLLRTFMAMLTSIAENLHLLLQGQPAAQRSTRTIDLTSERNTPTRQPATESSARAEVIRGFRNSAVSVTDGVGLGRRDVSPSFNADVKAGPAKKRKSVTALNAGGGGGGAMQVSQSSKVSKK